MQADEITNLWREKVGEIAGIKELTFADGIHIGGAAPLGFNFSGGNYASLENIANELEDRLNQYNGVFDIRRHRDRPLSVLARNAGKGLIE